MPWDRCGVRALAVTVMANSFDVCYMESPGPSGLLISLNDIHNITLLHLVAEDTGQILFLFFFIKLNPLRPSALLKSKFFQHLWLCLFEKTTTNKAVDVELIRTQLMP